MNAKTCLSKVFSLTKKKAHRSRLRSKSVLPNPGKNSFAEAHFGFFYGHKERIINFVHVEFYPFLFSPLCGQTAEFTALIKIFL